MMLSWEQGETAAGEVGERLIIVLSVAEAVQAVSTFVEIPLSQLGSHAEHLHSLTIILTGPVGGEAVLRRAVETRDGGGDVRYRGRPGIPDE